MTFEPAAVRIEVWSDVQCIWCYISSARLHRAVERFDGSVEVTYRSFELTPDAPVEIDRNDHIRNQHIDPARMRRVMAQLADLAAIEGLPYQPQRTRPTNSRLALELLHHADTLGMRRALTDRLFAAYFAEGRHIGRIDDLVDVAGSIGLDVVAARDALSARRHASDVDADIERARSLGARGVPLYAINDTVVLSGAQPVDAFLTAFRAAHRS